MLKKSPKAFFQQEPRKKICFLGRQGGLPKATFHTNDFSVDS